jgi:uncharacterized membrane protein YhaH (DUF805 family)
LFTCAETKRDACQAGSCGFAGRNELDQSNMAKGDMVMGAFSGLYWLIMIAVTVIWLIPAIKILHKAGYSGWWCLLLFVPVVNIVMYWVFAFARWPNLVTSLPGRTI